MAVYRQVLLQALTPEAFAAYGVVIDADAAMAGGARGRPINHGSSLRLEVPGALDLQGHGGEGVLAIFRAQARRVNGPWSELERHALGSQTFIPLGGARCVLLVALGDAAPDPARLAAFDVRGHQAFSLHAGTWHHGLIAREDGDFVVVERQGPVQTDGNRPVDCDIAHLAEPVMLIEAEAGLSGSGTSADRGR